MNAKNIIAPTKEEAVHLKQILSDEEPSLARLSETLCYAAWARLSEPGDSAALRLVAELGASAALQAVINKKISDQNVSAEVRQSFKSSLKRWLPRLDRAKTFEDLKIATANGATLLTSKQKEWPDKLEVLGDHQPLTLWCLGDTSLLGQQQLAIVGARASSSYGEKVTADFAAETTKLGVHVISGGAYGIDAAAHRAALREGGKTIVVLAGGIDRPYPLGHKELFKRVQESGLVISEMVPGSAPTRWRFLQRNRLIAALSNAVLVTEAGVRSGSLNTAAHAAQLGKPIGAVPGPITSVASLGSHKLLKEFNALMVTNNDDLKELLGIQETLFSDANFNDRELSNYSRLLDSLPLRGYKDKQEIVRDSGLSPEEVMAALAELEVIGKVVRAEGSLEVANKWRLAG